MHLIFENIKTISTFIDVSSGSDTQSFFNVFLQQTFSDSKNIYFHFILYFQQSRKSRERRAKSNKHKKKT